MGRWTTVKVPVEIKSRIKELAKKREMAQWELIAFAISMLSERKQLGKADILDKVSYYIMKLSYSVSALKLNPTKENLEWTRKTIDQIQQRLNLDLSDLQKAIENYYRKKNKESLIVLNMCWKLAIKKMILLLA